MINYLGVMLLQVAGELAPSAAEAAQTGKKGGMSMWMIMLVVIVVMYLLMILPQQRRQKQMNKFRESLQSGQKVVSAGGIYGTIKEVQGNAVVLEVSKDMTITVDKGSIVRLVDGTQTTK